jgi:hypothetical protein
MPLINIVIADPNGACGQAAYHQLKDLGFAFDPPEATASVVFHNQTAKKQTIVLSNAKAVGGKKGLSKARQPISKPSP